MKKQYQKATIRFESFELSQSISAGCEAFVTNQAQFQCAVEIPDLDATVFAPESCDMSAPPGGDDQICYHAPSDGLNTHAS